MTKAALEFNKKYNLVVSDASFKQLKEKNMQANDLAGKPKKNITEVLKRFFKTPWAVAALIIFIIIVLMSIIIPYTTNYSANDPISQGGASAQASKNLLASHKLVTEWKTSAQLSTISAVVAKGYNVPYDVMQHFNGQTLISWHPYDLINAQDAMYGTAKHVNTFVHSSIVGTDGLGRDIWTRTWAGTWSSLKLALLVVTVTTTIGTLIGSWIGLYVGTLVDILFMKLIAIYNSIPTIVWYSIILFLLPPGYWSLVTIFIVTGWMAGLGTARMYMWKYVNSDFMKAAETYGVGKFGRIVKHALPNYLGVIALSFVSAIPGIIEGEASLAFLGFSPSPSAASLGNVLNEAQKAAQGGLEQIWYLLLPTIIIFTLTVSLKFVAIGLNDAIDPKYGRN